MATSGGMHVRHLFGHVCAGSLSSRAVQGSIGSNDVIHELTNGLLVLAVGLETMDKGELDSLVIACAPHTSLK